MKPSHRIRARLSLASLVFLALVLLLGGVSIGMIAYGNAASSDIRDRWLQNTRLIGDFENFTSDYRADEGSLLLSSTPDGINANRDDMAMLDRALGQSRDEFVRLPHDPAEASLYHRFETQWQQYKQAEGQVFASFKSGDLTNAVALYQTVSKLAYTQVSDTLETLRTTNIAEVMAASARSETTNRTVLWLIVLAVVITDALALLALLYIRRSTFNPLIDLIGSMQSLAHNDTDITIRGTLRTDEIGDLARAVLLFKQNIIALDGSRKTLEQQAVMLLEKIEEEQQLTMHQRNFVSMASHEFRTPLNIIDGHAQRLIRHKSAVDASEIEMRTGEIRAAVSRMTHLIDTVLDANRLMDGKIQLYLQPSDIDLAVLLGDVCRQHQEISPHARIQTSVRPASLPLFGDYKLIFQAFSNIIGNAIKYSESKYPIIVSAEKKELEILVTVSDKGIGIPSSDVSRLFDRYYRGSNVSGIIGTGIGLYLVKMVIDHHQGTIDVSSIEGAGTQITVRLPCQLPAPRTAARIAETAILD